MVSRESIETAYCFFHQKWNVYVRSNMEWQRDDIEYAIASYSEEMSPELYQLLSNGRQDFLRSHATFTNDLTTSLSKLEEMMKS